MKLAWLGHYASATDTDVPRPCVDLLKGVLVDETQSQF
jgi:hypothetical protein